ncbi:ISL3 family transposase [Dactylosporangium sp. NPDC005572]|uniref:ISL3 family transposase n=1 Tax=Dactylosporangium sp. NPDC005572 TaxID=3156889 RepID=UPI0033AD8768
MRDHTITEVVLPHLSGVLIERVEFGPEANYLFGRARGETAACPGCGTVSTSVRGRYQRRVADTPIGGRPVWLVLQVRRFNCQVIDCTVRTFVEQVPGLTVRRRRRSQPLQDLLHGIGAALAGRVGVRLAAKLAMDVSRSTLLRLLRCAPEPTLTVAPRVLGIDDFALRKGQVYATILLDMNTHRPVDVLPDREADTVAAWLRAHPGAEIICRDRAGAFADGATAGAPDAIQVADRWHLWRNLGEAVEAVVVAHRASLAEPPTQPTEAAQPPQPKLLPQPEEPAAVPDKEIRLVTRTRERYTQVQQLLAEGASRAEVSRRLGLDPQTVRRFADATSIDELLANTRRDSLIDPYTSYLHQRWNDGCTDTATLYAETREQGYRGSVQTLRRYLQPLRPVEGGTRRRLPAPNTPPPPKPRRVAKWIMSDPVKPKTDDQHKLDVIRERSPALDALVGHVQDFADMMRKLRGARLPQWIAAVLASDLAPLHSFAKGLQRDLAAVTAGLTLPWSSGAVEGQVNRVKMLSSSRGRFSPRLSQNRT